MRKNFSLSMIVAAIAITLVLGTASSPSVVSAASLPVLGVTFTEGVDKFSAAIGSLNVGGGAVLFGKPSDPYDIDSQLMPCINAQFTSAGNVAYAVQTVRNDSKGQPSYTFDLVDVLGTVAKLNYSIFGVPLSYLVVAWAYSNPPRFYFCRLAPAAWRDCIFHHVYFARWRQWQW